MGALEVVARATGLIVGCNQERQADAILSALTAAGFRILAPGQIDDVAAAMWREEAVDCGAPESVARGRTREAFDDQAEELKARWRKFAKAASSALSQPHPAEAKLAKVEAKLATEKEAHRLTRVAEFAKISYRDKRFAEMEAKIGRISAELAEARKREELARIVIGDLLADHAPIGLRGIQALNKAVSFLASKEASR